MTLPSGSRIGPYEILAKIGAGGMGEVYRARDTKLDRDVAIKVLPSLVANDPERLVRFEREAKTLAALNHTNIAHVYDAGQSDAVAYLVMELVDGDDLSAHIAHGPMPIVEALPVAKQIAEALEAAHEHGIIHRDLKPANIKIRPDGVVKVLDFGLAKALSPDGAGGSSNPSNSPTLTARATQMGMILGTAAYMAPEQARGRTVDKRADIWAFGVVLYEMVTGRRAFGASTRSESDDDMTAILARVIERDPDWTALPAATPPALRRLLERCLTKDPKSRLRDIGEARHTLDELIAGRSGSSIDIASRDPTGTGTAALPTTPGAGRTARIAWLTAAIFAATTVALALRPRLPGTAATLATGPTRVELKLPDGVEFYASACLSPNGRRVLFVGNKDGVRQVFLRDLDQASARPLSGTEGAIFTVFSPDSKSAALISTEARVKRIDLETGAIEELVSGVEIVGGLYWTADDRILFGRVTSLQSVAATGGAAKQIVALTPGSNETSLVGPVATPDGKTVLFTVWSGPPGAQKARIDAVPIDGGARRVVVENGAYVLAVLPDRLVYQRELAIYAAPFDAVRAVVTGVAPVKLMDEVRYSPTGGLAADISPAGDLIFADKETFNGRLSWVTFDGVERPIPVPARAYNNPRVSPDGRTVAYSDAASIWTTDTERGAQSKIFTGTDALTGFPVWSKDGAYLYFRSTSGTIRLRADGSGTPEPITGSMRQDYPNAISPDGKSLVLTRILADTSGDIVLLPTEGGTAKVVLASPAYEGGAQFSPDGKWLTFVSNVSARMEVYIRPVDGSGQKQVSTSGGLGALWSKDGKRIFFRNNQQFLAVDVITSPTLQLSAPKVLFERRYSFGPNLTIANYSLANDRNEFLLVTPGSGHLNLIFNWLQTAGR